MKTASPLTFAFPLCAAPGQPHQVHEVSTPPLSRALLSLPGLISARCIACLGPYCERWVPRILACSWHC